MRTIIASDERIAIVATELAVDVFLRLLECDVHITVNG